MKTLLHSILTAFFALSLLTGCDKDEEVTPQTSLELTLTDNLGNPVSGANVKLYSSQTDWKNSTNQIGTTQTSNANGKVTFTGLQPIQYYWFTQKDCSNNFNGSATTTTPLTAAKTNTLSSVLTDTGTLSFTNTSANPYQVFVNGTLLFTAQGNQSYEFEYAPTGTYSIRVLQVSGYAVYPTDVTYTGTLECGSSLTTTFPN